METGQNVRINDRMNSMPYEYSNEKKRVFEPENQIMFLAIRDNVQRLLKSAGAVRMQEAWSGVGGGDTWIMCACVDRLVEIGELVELKRDCFLQHRVFVASRE